MKAINLEVKLDQGNCVADIAYSMDLAESMVHTTRKNSQNKVQWSECNTLISYDIALFA